MTSIIVSSDDLEVGDKVGAMTAEALGYDVLDRRLLAQVAERFDVKEEKLVRLLNRAPSRLSSKTRDLLLARVQTAVLERLQEGGVVCTNLAAHLYARGVSHVLVIRVLADSEARADATAKAQKVPLRKAQKIIEREKANRSRWSMETYGLDENDPSLYDMVISLSQIEEDKAVEIIRDMSCYRKFRPMSYSVKCMNDLVLSSAVRTSLLPEHPDVQVSADGDKVVVRVKCAKRLKQSIAAAIKKSVGRLPGVRLVEVHAVTSLRHLNQQDS
jgi:cytidylate kinase